MLNENEHEDKNSLDCRDIVILIEKQSQRMEILEHKFDSLLVSIDNKMEKLINVLISRQEFPVKMFGWILAIVLLAIFTAIFGQEVVMNYAKVAKI